MRRGGVQVGVERHESPEQHPVGAQPQARAAAAAGLEADLSHLWRQMAQGEVKGEGKGKGNGVRERQAERKMSHRRIASRSHGTEKTGNQNK